MSFQLSPSVRVTETDLTNIIPAVATSTASTVGQFAWGPVEEITIVQNEEQLASLFGKPSLTVYKDFLVASSFLAYASNLHLVRVVGSGALNATATEDELVSGTGILVKNTNHYEVTDFTSSANLWVAKYPGALGNSIGVAWCDAANFDLVDSNNEPVWAWKGLFNSAPVSNEFHIVVFDADGKLTGQAGTALERYSFVSPSTTAKAFDGTTAYFKNKINNESVWIWVGRASLMTGYSNGVQLAAGNDGAAITSSDRATGIDLFRNAEEVDISLIFAAGGDAVASRYMIDNIAEFRKDCIACVSVQESDVVGQFSEQTILNNILTTRTGYGSSSYAVMDSAYKYMYDRHNDVYRWVPLNGDIAGLIAKTDNDVDPWFSPAGFNRGRIKNAVKLSHNQPETIRDELYKRGVNPCQVFPVDGPVLFGDKTLLTRPSAFDRINVRRLFIVLEKAISTAARHLLFEQNDDFTRARFVNMVEPFLRDVMGRRGITDFRVVCDGTNNTGEVIDRNEFVADIYIKPTRSINFIRLNFVAVRTGVSFDEIVQGTTNQGPTL